MSGPIQSPAPGYLSLMSLKVMGRLPAQAADVVQPHLNILPFWVAGQRRTDDIRYLTDVITAANSPDAFFPFKDGGGQVLKVPDGEVWYVTAAMFELSTGAGSVFSCRAALATKPDSCLAYAIQRTVTLELESAATSTGTTGSGAPLFEPFFAMGGEIFIAQVFQGYGAGEAICTLRIEHLKLLA